VLQPSVSSALPVRVRVEAAADAAVLAGEAICSGSSCPPLRLRAPPYVQATVIATDGVQTATLPVAQARPASALLGTECDGDLW
jgi:hypothetical protein